MKIWKIAVSLFLVLSCSSAFAEAAERVGEDSSSSYGKPQGVLGDFTFGPQLTFVGFPTPFRFGLETKYANLIGFGMEYGFIPSFSISGVNLSFNTFQGSAKIYPFRGAFYFGLYMGSQSLSFSTATNLSNVPVTLSVNASVFYWTPTIGWKWVQQSGFYWGLDLGWQLALSSSITYSSNPPALVSAAQQTSQGTQLVNDLNSINSLLSSLPSVALLQIGYLF